MKISILIINLIISINISFGQTNVRNSLWGQFSTAKDDTTKVLLLANLGDVYSTDISPDSALLISQQGFELAESIGYIRGEMECRISIARAAQALGDFETTIKLGYPVMVYAKESNDNSLLESAFGVLAEGYQTQGDYVESMKWASKSLDLLTRTTNCMQCAARVALIGSSYYGLGRYDSALVYLKKALSYQQSWGFGWIALLMGRTQQKLNNDSSAFYYYYQSINDLSKSNNSQDLPSVYTAIAALYLKNSSIDSAIHYGKLSYTYAAQKHFNKEAMDACLLLSEAYEKINTTEALHFYKLAMSAKDDLYSAEKQRQIVGYKFNEQLRQNEIKTTEEKYQNQIRMYILLGLLFFFLVFMIILYRNNRQKKKANIILQEQKQKVENTLEQLKSTQSQLIQSEKMASLGELTAGIAHEIQNPLNFVNNFSEVNKEMIDELQIELKSGNVDEAINISNDIKDNEEKINHHGKRAEAIVKGMLQHSRKSTGQKESTDINALCDEYLRLSYHGLRAKDKDFNATMKTDFDESIGKINIIPQDIGRVLLNLYNNAFYAVNEKKKLQPDNFEAIVAVSTKKIGDKIEIRVSDNGDGISQKIVDKIFQPFFTTKPTGQGTGLGLSLSYDIIKAHGGEIKVESREGTEFIIQLPVKTNGL
ncbi:hypothetical protein BH10BAC2_BH10BAC2_39130 [soil metagenome]